MQRESCVPNQSVSARGLHQQNRPFNLYLLKKEIAAHAAQFACQPSLSQCAVCHPLEKLRCLACNPPFAVNADGLCGVPSPATGIMRSRIGFPVLAGVAARSPGISMA